MKGGYMFIKEFDCPYCGAEHGGHFGPDMQNTRLEKCEYLGQAVVLRNGETVSTKGLACGKVFAVKGVFEVKVEVAPVPFPSYDT
jgi:hypothetical protein